MGIKTFHQRLAELYVLNKQRALTTEEMLELQHCMAANVKYCWDMAYLENMSLLASMANDTEWQHEICAEIDAMEYGSNTKKSAPRKRKADNDKKDRS